MAGISENYDSANNKPQKNDISCEIHSGIRMQFVINTNSVISTVRKSIIKTLWIKLQTKSNKIMQFIAVNTN